MKMILWDDANNKVEAVHIRTVSGTALINFLVNTRNFSGHYTLFIPSTEIKKYVDILQDMYTDLAGGLNICDSESDSVIRLDKKENQWFLCGQLGCSWEHNVMMFHILVDQTVIQILLDFMQSIVAGWATP